MATSAKATDFHADAAYMATVQRVGGTVQVTRSDGTVDVHPTLGEGARGIGVVDLARAIQSGDPVRASGQLAYHVLDALVAIAESAVSGEFPRVSSSTTVPELLPVGWDRRTATL